MVEPRQPPRPHRGHRTGTPSHIMPLVLCCHTTPWIAMLPYFACGRSRHSFYFKFAVSICLCRRFSRSSTARSTPSPVPWALVMSYAALLCYDVICYAAVCVFCCDVCFCVMRLWVMLAPVGLHCPSTYGYGRRYLAGGTLTGVAEFLREVTQTDTRTHTGTHEHTRTQSYTHTY